MKQIRHVLQHNIVSTNFGTEVSRISSFTTFGVCNGHIVCMIIARCTSYPEVMIFYINLLFKSYEPSKPYEPSK